MRKILTAAVAFALAALLAALAGCAGAGVGSAAVAKYAKAQKAAECPSAAEYLDLFIVGNATQEQMQQGASITVIGADLQALVGDAALDKGFNLPVSTLSQDVAASMKTATFYRVGDRTDDGRWTMLVCAIDFDDETAAVSFHSNLSLKLQAEFETFAVSTDWTIESSKESGKVYDIAKATNEPTATTMYEGLYQQGKSVLLVVCMDLKTTGGAEAVSALCSKLEIPDPTGLTL